MPTIEARRDALPAGRAVGLSLLVWLGACSTNAELPPVTTPLFQDLGCRASAYGRPVTHPRVTTADGLGLYDCIARETAACRSGELSFTMRVDSRGHLLALSIAGDAPPAVKDCVRAQLGYAVVSPAEDCRQSAVDDTLQGTATWDSMHIVSTIDGATSSPWGCRR
jgi:hypothetical protein